MHAAADDETVLWYRHRDDLIVVSIWIIMLAYALVANILIVVGIARNAAMRSATSYWFIISLAACDCLMSVISLVHLVPATAFHDAYVTRESARNIWMLFVYNLFWYTGVLQLALMAVNRFVSIVYPMEYKSMFSRNRTLLIIAFGYAMGLCASLPTLFPCCHTLWNADAYITEYAQPDTWYKYLDLSVNSLSLVLMIICYAIIIYRVRESGRAMAKYQLTLRARQVQQQPSQRDGDPQLERECSLRPPPRTQVNKKEMRLFVQFCMVSLIFLLTFTTWQWLPHMSESKWAYFVMTSLFFINNSVNPTVYLIYNTALRHEVHYMVCRERAIAAAHERRKRTLLHRQMKNNNNNNTTTTDGSNRALLAAAAQPAATITRLQSSQSSSSTDFVLDHHRQQSSIKQISMTSP